MNYNMFIKRSFFFLLNALLLFSFSARSQDINVQDTVKNEYYKSYSEYINFRGITSFRNLSINLSEKGREPIANYTPNNRGFIGFGAFIFDLGLEVAFKYPKAFEKNPEKYGTTEFVDIQSQIFGKKINFNITYQHYEGFYLSNVNEFERFFSEEIRRPIREDLKATNAIFGVMYLFNTDKFSLRSAFNQTEKQLKNAGSFLILPSLSYFRLKGDSVLHYSKSIEPSDNGISFIDGKFYTFSISPGYAYNAVWRNFLFNVTASTGAGIQHQFYFLENDSHIHAWKVEPEINFRSAITYDNNRLFAGLNYIIHNSFTSVTDMRIQTEVSNFRIFAGYRIKKFGIFKKYSVNQLINSVKEKVFGTDESDK